jgi:two-component system LytT family sensor kinase
VALREKDMKQLRHIFLLLLLVVSSGLFAQQKQEEAVQKVEQKQKAPSKTKRQVRRDYLGDARDLREKSPKQAVDLVEEALLYARKDNDVRTQAEAYTLLGNIYEDIGQKELALKRYQQALDALNRSKSGGNTAPIYQRMGQLYLDQRSDKDAETSFKLCIETSDSDATIRQRCEEGMADVELLRGNAKGSISQLDNVQRNFTLDSVSVARLEAKRSNVYIQQNDFPNASQSYLNSISNLPRNSNVSKEDYQAIELAQSNLLAYEAADVASKVEIASNSAVANSVLASNDDVISGNLKVATVYEEEKKMAEAERFIARSKALVNERTDAALAAEVFKKSAEINRRKGNFADAVRDMERYVAEREKTIAAAEAELAQQVEIVKGQQRIDVQEKDYDIEERERALLQTQVSRQRMVIGLLSVLLLASLVFFYFLRKNIREKQRAHQKLLLKSLRTQMNPHFIFNALNSVNSFIANQDEKAANKYLAEFSRLMRKVLDHSQKDFIPFEEEMELNELYLRLEHFRFRDQFEFSFENKAHAPDLEVPPMLIQPFIENAVWHGLRYKEGKGHLSVKVSQDATHITVTIEDDGIGRERSKAIKTEGQRRQKSAGLENVSKRIALINELYGKNYEISVSDSDVGAGDVGTRVRVRVPV